MREQIAQYPRRASATAEELQARRTVTSANAHRVGHSAGFHPEDKPYLSGNVRRKDVVADEVADDDSLYPQRMPSSTRRYTTTQGHHVIEQGNKRIVIHNEPPPKLKRRFHWMFFVGLAFFVMVIGWIAFTFLANWWSAKQLDWTYGNPRTFQIDQFVGHGDSATHPNHFIAINVGGTIEVVEMNTTNPKDDHIYVVSTISSSSTPATVSFQDVNHDGKIDMLVTVGESNPYTVVLLNNGSVFLH